MYEELVNQISISEDKAVLMDIYYNAVNKPWNSIKRHLKLEGQCEAYKLYRTEEGKEAILAGYNSTMKSVLIHFVKWGHKKREQTNVNVHLLLTTKAEESKNKMFLNQQMPQNAKFREERKLYVCW